MKDINEKATRWPQIQGVTLHYEEIIKYLLHRHSLLHDNSVRFACEVQL